MSYRQSLSYSVLQRHYILFFMQAILSRVTIFIFLILPLIVQAQNNEKVVETILSQLTVEEKLRLIIGGGFTEDASLRNALNKVPGAVGKIHPVKRLNIPATILSDGPAGVRIRPYRGLDSSRTYFATGFPVATSLASTWDTNLVKELGVALGKEAKEYGIDVLLIPALNIQRNPLNGRNFEYFSEDPLISGTMAAALINGIQTNGVGTSIKHYAANNQETDRKTVDEIISERALREIYLRAFQIALKRSEPWTLMSSYNKINGIYAAENEDLITNVLRGEWGFKGLVVTDWHAGKHIVQQVVAGTDLIMPGKIHELRGLTSAYKNDSLSIKAIDKSVKNILQLILKTPVYNGYKYSDTPDLKANAILSRKVAAEGMILLKNNQNTLPLKSDLGVALLGAASYNTIANGRGSGEVNKAYVTSVEQGLTNANYVVDSQSEIASADELAQSNDVAVITIGRNSVEGRDRKIENDYYLTSQERKLIKELSRAFHAKNKKVVVVLNVTSLVDLSDWQDDVDAVLLAWHPGMEAGNAIADVLSGKVNPSGKLAITIPKKYQDVPSAAFFPGVAFTKENPSNNASTTRVVEYKEDIYVGYRHFLTKNIEPAYPFGYGMSYTNFEFSKVSISSNDFKQNLDVSVTVKNNGKVAGKEVVQLYLNAPKASLDKPLKELKGFAKTKLLAPGESQTLKLTITQDELASFNTQRSAWIADKGKYMVTVGNSSVDNKNELQFELKKEIVVEKTNTIKYPDSVKALQ